MISFLISVQLSNANKTFKSKSNYELKVLKKLIQTWIIFLCKGQMTLVLKMHYFIDGIHCSAYTFGPKGANLLHSPVSPPSPSASVLFFCLIKYCSKIDFRSFKNTAVQFEMNSHLLLLGIVTKLHHLKITEFF